MKSRKGKTSFRESRLGNGKIYTRGRVTTNGKGTSKLSSKKGVLQGGSEKG